ncbi:MAG: ATP-binding cassette domain-containing protein [Planctomycetes bacterium]|nr:ATP-binding cassette domain-containing protein [Planctomycetota bacterium]
MAILHVADLTFGFGTLPLIQNVTLSIEAGERVGLLGRNGVGKSTLLQLIAGELNPEAGAISLQPGTRVTYLAQTVPSNNEGTVFDKVAEGLGPLGDAVATQHRLSRRAEADPALLDQAVHRLSEEGGWDQLHRVERTLAEMGLNADDAFDTLSAGRKRRVLLARALVGGPDLLLLDEPTNHLDIDSIVWLEDYLLRFSGTLIFITHDRAFLQALATRVVELERARIFDFATDYRSFLRYRDELLESEAKREAQFDKKLAEEEIWLRKGMKARRKRNEGRVKALEAMRLERSRRRVRGGTVKLTAIEAERSGQRVVQAEGITFAYGTRPIVRDLSTEIYRGDRIGVIGPNGAGKTTLLRILLGDLQPQSGTVKLGARLAVAYFDQLRHELDERKTIRESVAPGQETVDVNGRSRNVLSYLKDFLFPPDRVGMGVGVLSGGERNRLLLARLFARPSNVLVLDEPTNDLDAETLELLEELLAEYPGTVFLVSHDRAFLNNVVTSTIAFEGDGVLKEYAGGYDDYLRQRPKVLSPVAATSTKPTYTPTAPAQRKLSFKERRELEALPAKIEALEARQKQLHREMAEPDYHRQGAQKISAARSELSAIEQDLAASYARWEELDAVGA